MLSRGMIKSARRGVWNRESSSVIWKKAMNGFAPRQIYMITLRVSGLDTKGRIQLGGRKGR